MSKRFTKISPGKLRTHQSFKYAEKENKRRISVLKQGNKTAKKIAEKLKHCKKYNRCNSPACAKCSHRFRNKQLDCAAKILEGERPLYFVTLIAVKSSCNRKGLRQLSLRSFKNTISKQFERCRLGGKIVIGSVEVAFRPQWDRFVLHAHLCIAGASPDDIEKLRGLYPTKGDLQGLNKKLIEDGTEEHLLSYCLKLTTYARIGNRRKPIPLKIKDEIAMLKFFDRHQFKQFLVKKNVNYVNGKFLPLPPWEEDER